MTYTIFGENYTPKFGLPIGGKYHHGDFVEIDLSSSNPELVSANAHTPEGLSAYVEKTIARANAKVGYGGYAEKRDLYARSDHFAKDEGFRNIHLGIDFWMPAGTEILAPLPGKVHSFANNDNPCDYGPTIVLEHYMGNEHFYTLYGHLSVSSLPGLVEGMLVTRGQKLATLGKPSENRDWPPHLHFQIIKNIGDYRGDYPGVCSERERKQYLHNSPDPLQFFAPSFSRLMGLSAS